MLTGQGEEDARPVFIRAVQGHVASNPVNIADRVRVTIKHTTLLWRTTKKELLPSILERGLIPSYRGRSELFTSILDPYRAPKISASATTEFLGWNDTHVQYVPYTYDGSVILTINVREACAHGCEFFQQPSGAVTRRQRIPPRYILLARCSKTGIQTWSNSDRRLEGDTPAAVHSTDYMDDDDEVASQ